jgi:hypothetical protein
MNIDKIRSRQREIVDVLSTMEGRHNKWANLKAESQTQIDKLERELRDERDAQLRGERNRADDVAKQLLEARDNLAKANAHLVTFQMSDADKQDRKLLENELNSLKEQNTWTQRSPGLVEKISEIQTKIAEIDAKYTIQDDKRRAAELRSELKSLEEAETNYGIFRAMCDNEIGQSIRNEFASVYAQAERFEETDYFFQAVAKACKTRLST